ncbi:MAG TPA: hypothetical protein VGE76_07450 [Opitutaceae bacterium]
MNLQPPRDPWTRLATAARNARDERDTTAPYGFATRMAALAMAQERRVVSLFDRFALRAFGVSCLLALGSLLLNYNSLTSPQAPVAMGEHAAVDGLDTEVPQDDVVSLVLDIGG